MGGALPRASPWPQRYWLAVAYAEVGDGARARKEPVIALETSTTRNDRALYAAKLDRIKRSPGP